MALRVVNFSNFLKNIFQSFQFWNFWSATQRPLGCRAFIIFNFLGSSKDVGYSRAVIVLTTDRIWAAGKFWSEIGEIFDHFRPPRLYLTHTRVWPPYGRSFFRQNWWKLGIPALGRKLRFGICWQCWLVGASGDLLAARPKYGSLDSHWGSEFLNAQFSLIVRSWLYSNGLNGSLFGLFVANPRDWCSNLDQKGATFGPKVGLG